MFPDLLRGGYIEQLPKQASLYRFTVRIGQSPQCFGSGVKVLQESSVSFQVLLSLKQLIGFLFGIKIHDPFLVEVILQCKGQKGQVCNAKAAFDREAKRRLDLQVSEKGYQVCTRVPSTSTRVESSRIRKLILLPLLAVHSAPSMRMKTVLSAIFGGLLPVAIPRTSTTRP